MTSIREELDFAYLRGLRDGAAEVKDLRDELAVTQRRVAQLEAQLAKSGQVP